MVRNSASEPPRGPLLRQVMLLSGLSGAEMALLDVGIKITPGAGVGAAIKYLQGTASTIRGRDLQ